MKSCTFYKDTYPTLSQIKEDAKLKKFSTRNNPDFEYWDRNHIVDENLTVKENRKLVEEHNQQITVNRYNQNVRESELRKLFREAIRASLENYTELDAYLSSIGEKTAWDNAASCWMLDDDYDEDLENYFGEIKEISELLTTVYNYGFNKGKDSASKKE